MSAPGSSQAVPEAAGDADGTGNNLNHHDATEVRPPTATTQSTPGTRQTPEGRRLIQRISILLGQRTGLNRVMLVVLTAALILGLLGFAMRALWIVVIIIIAVGLGYVGANSRRDRTDAVNQRQEDELDTARRG